MSEPKWTPAQRAAIEDRGGALLVSAAAGSGKTAVLTERAVRLITDPDHPVDADKLLIVTFTNAAAAELRARIGQALLRLSQQQPHNTSLRRQRMLLQRAPICTIDAFCLDLLHKHFQALDGGGAAQAIPSRCVIFALSAAGIFWENGFAFTCWHDLLLAEAARCAKAARELLTAALADCKGRLCPCTGTGRGKRQDRCFQGKGRGRCQR